VSLDDNGELVFEAILKGETVHEVLDYVQVNGRDLINRLQSAVDAAVRCGRMDHAAAGRFVKFYEEALAGYTYLEEAPTADS
jgi:arginine decarboxylase